MCHCHGGRNPLKYATICESKYEEFGDSDLLISDRPKKVESNATDALNLKLNVKN